MTTKIEKFRAFLDGMIDTGTEDTDHIIFGDSSVPSIPTVWIAYVDAYGERLDYITGPSSNTTEGWRALGEMIPGMVRQQRVDHERWKEKNYPSKYNPGTRVNGKRFAFTRGIIHHPLKTQCKTEGYNAEVGMGQIQICGLRPVGDGSRERQDDG